MRQGLWLLPGRQSNAGVFSAKSMKQISCPNPKCKAKFRTIFYGLTICETKSNISNNRIRYERNPRLKNRTEKNRTEEIEYSDSFPYPWSPSYAAFKKNTVGFYCEKCSAVFTEEKNEEIFTYIKNYKLLNKLIKN